jgi:integrase
MAEALRVGRGRGSVYVYPSTNGSGRVFWRFRSPITGKDVRRVKRNEARDAAKDELDAIAKDEAAFLKLTRTRKKLLVEVMEALPSDQALRGALDYLRRMPSAKTVEELAGEFIADKVTARGFLSHHLRAVKKDLDTLAERVPGRTLESLTTEDLKSWHAERVGTAGPKRRNDCRQNLLSLYNYAVKMGDLPDAGAVNVARRLPIAAIEEKKAIRYADRAEALVILRNVSESYRLWAVLGLFAGLRPEEIIPEPGRHRRGLDRSEIDHETGTVYVPREVAGKAKAARRVPFSPKLEEWLRWAGWFPGQRGPIGKQSATRGDETFRLGVILDKHFRRSEGWPQDLLRRTYASHRAPILRSLAALALEMGNSEGILKDHYNQPLPEKEAEAFFALTPADLAEATIIEGDFQRAK